MFWLAFAVGLCVVIALLAAARVGQCKRQREKMRSAIKVLEWYAQECHAMAAAAFWLALGAFILAVGLAKGWVG